MPPKNSTDKITKSKATPKKGRASNNASPAKADTKANQNLLFLWSCLQSTHTKVSILSLPISSSRFIHPKHCHLMIPLFHVNTMLVCASR